jgi:hypothetical protein
VISATKKVEGSRSVRRPAWIWCRSVWVILKNAKTSECWSLKNTHIIPRRSSKPNPNTCTQSGAGKE